MNIHFLYRYWSVRYPHLIRFFSEPIFIVFLSAFPTAIFIIWYASITVPNIIKIVPTDCFCMFGTIGGLFDPSTIELWEEFRRKYRRIIMDGWLIIDHWVKRFSNILSLCTKYKKKKYQRNGIQDFKFIFTVVFLDILMITSFTVALSLGCLTFFHIRQAHKISNQMRNLQQKLVMAVTAQVGDVWMENNTVYSHYIPITSDKSDARFSDLCLHSLFLLAHFPLPSNVRLRIGRTVHAIDCLLSCMGCSYHDCTDEGLSVRSNFVNAFSGSTEIICKMVWSYRLLVV